MRKLKRAIAHNKMRAEGITKPNHKPLLPNGRRGKSFFALNWRKFVK